MKKTIFSFFLVITIGIFSANAQTNVLLPVSNATVVQAPVASQALNQQIGISVPNENLKAIEKLQNRLAALEQGRGKAFPEHMYLIFKGGIESQIEVLRNNKK